MRCKTHLLSIKLPYHAISYCDTSLAVIFVCQMRIFWAKLFHFPRRVALQLAYLNWYIRYNICKQFTQLVTSWCFQCVLVVLVLVCATLYQTVILKYRCKYFVIIAPSHSISVPSEQAYNLISEIVWFIEISLQITQRQWYWCKLYICVFCFCFTRIIIMKSTELGILDWRQSYE